VQALQHLLTHAFSGQALAGRRVTENPGKNTPGVDKVLWKDPEEKGMAITKGSNEAIKLSHCGGCISRSLMGRNVLWVSRQ